MNMKINTICFILLLFLLVGVASASDSDNETLHIIKQPAQEINTTDNIVSKSIDTEIKIGSTNKNIITATSKTASTSNSKLKVNLKASDVKMYYGDGSQFKITLKDNNKKVMKNTKISINLNGKTYSKTTDSKGTASIKLNVNSGTYKVTTTYAGSSKYQKQSIKNTITVKSTIKANDYSKYYKNTKTYSATFYNTNGKVLKKTNIKYCIGKTTQTIKTDSKGIVKIKTDFTPGKYEIGLGNTKTGEVIKKMITIKPTLEHKSFKMDDNGNTQYSVKVLNNNGNAYSNQKVTFNIDGKTYTQKSNSNGIATLSITLNSGKHTILTEYNGLKIKYEFNVAKNTKQTTENVKKTNFTHTISIPNYVNITMPYVFHNSEYALKTGENGIIKLPKNELIIIETSSNSYMFTNSYNGGYNTHILGSSKYLIPFDGHPLQREFKKEKLSGDGIIISQNGDNIEIEFKSTTEHNTDLFGVYLNKGFDISEIITYVQNNKIKAKVNFFSETYDETGLKNNIVKYYGKSIYDFNNKNYSIMTNGQTDLIKYTVNNEPISFSYFGNYVSGAPSHENIMTKFNINNKEELEKSEIISYGLSEDYKSNAGFEVLQSYAIINEKITDDILLKWLDKNSSYLSKTGIANVYSMFLTALETAWLADKMADENAKDFNVNWKRDTTATILGGINLKDTYLNILNADMGMNITGQNDASGMFRLTNSIILPSIEDYSLKALADIYDENSTNSLDNVISALNNKTFSIAQINETMFIFTEDETKSAIIVNLTSGVANVIMEHNNTVYKGSIVKTGCDCCSVGFSPLHVVNQIYATQKNALQNNLKNLLKNSYPISMMAFKCWSFIIGKNLVELTGSKAIGWGLLSIMFGLQEIGNYYKENIADEKDWYSLMDTITFTRPGYLQGKKVYNIPNKNGGYDYIEIPIKGNFELDRDNSIYISDGKTKKLTKEETYKYYDSEYYTPFSVPSKYWNKSFRK